MNLDEFLDLVEGVRVSGNGWEAICPAHDDNEASLGVSETDDRLLVTCRAGCPTPNVLTALGLNPNGRDLFFRPRGGQDWGDPEAIYPYVDEQGVEIYQAVRFPGKIFRQRHMGPDGEWIWNLEDCRRVLYRLPEVISAVAEGRKVWVVEGEKDVEALRAAGVTATCNPMGAGKWRDEYAEPLEGGHVVIVQDRDEPGRNHADRVKRSLLGRAVSVYLLQARKGKDAADHLGAGLGLADFEEVRVRLARGVFTSVDLSRLAMEHLEMGEGDIPAWEPIKLGGGNGRGIVYRGGRIYTIGAYTGDGKTAWAVQTTRGFCESGLKTGYFSLELTEEDVRNRLLEHKGIPLEVLERPWTMKGTPWEARYTEAVEEFHDWPLEVIFNPGITAERILSQTQDSEYGAIIIDHVHRFSWGSERRRLESELTELTNLALDHNIPVILLAQLRRYQRGQGMSHYPRPTLQDYRETEMLAMESAMGMALWRARAEDGLTYDPSGQTELIVLKDRHGPLRGYFLRFDGPTQLFTEGTPHAGFSYESDEDAEDRGAWGDHQLPGLG